MKPFFAILWICTLSLPGLGQIPAAVIPQGVGVNIHFVRGRERDLDRIAAAGFKFIRMDFNWQEIERGPGQYTWEAYDELTANLKKRGLRAIYILDYCHPDYEPVVDSVHAVGPRTPEKHIASPRHPESIAAFARWSAAAARHFHGQNVIWEIYNEPNGDFWRPKPDAQEYTALALAAAKAIRQAEPSAVIIAPALAGFAWKFLDVFVASGVLDYLDAVSVHPYRAGQHPPETAAADYQKLRELLDRYAPPGKSLPILSGEWGYSSNTKGVSLDTQAAFAVRQQLANLLNGIPLSIWYDWKNDGTDPDDGEQNFGTVTDDLKPKLAYGALQTMTRQLSGCKISRRIADFGKDDFVLLCVNDAGEKKIAAWTLSSPHAIQLTLAQPSHRAIPGVLGSGEAFSAKAEGQEISIEISALPRYLDLKTQELK
jgi:hypothetical protein